MFSLSQCVTGRFREIMVSAVCQWSILVRIAMVNFGPSEAKHPGYSADKKGNVLVPWVPRLIVSVARTTETINYTTHFWPL